MLVQCNWACCLHFILVGSDRAILRNSQTDLWRKSRRLGKWAVSFLSASYHWAGIKGERASSLSRFRYSLLLGTPELVKPNTHTSLFGPICIFSSVEQVVRKVDRIPRLLFDKPVSGPNLTLHPILPLFSLFPFRFRLVEHWFSHSCEKGSNR